MITNRATGTRYPLLMRHAIGPMLRTALALCLFALSATPTSAQQKPGTVPMRVFATTSRAGAALRLLVVAEPAVPGTKLAAASMALYDATGALAAEWTASAAALKAPALMTTFDRDPGKYRVRVAVKDTAGRAGTADLSFDAMLTPAANGLSLSSIVLLNADGVPKLQFGSDASAIDAIDALDAMVSFELYGGRTGLPVSINLELAATADGPAIATLQPKVAASPEPDKFLITAPLDLTALPAGDYIIRAIVGLDGFPATRILRTFRKTR